jgi:hypothetical protein
MAQVLMPSHILAVPRSNVLRLGLEPAISGYTAGGDGCFFWKQPIVNRFQGCSRRFFLEQPMQHVQNILLLGCFQMEQ